MKKSFLIAAMAGLAFVGCTESDLDKSVTSQQAIRFNAPAVRPTTKAATEFGQTFDPAKDFNVFGTWFETTFNGFTNGKVYIDEATAEYDANTWYPLNGGNYYYWPKNGSITFSAYAPASVNMKAAATVGTNGLTFTDYVVSNADNSAMEDVLFSERAYDKTASVGSGTPYEGVDIRFRHALASIVFNAKLKEAYTGTNVTIKGISLSGVESKATFNQNLDNANGATTKLPDGTGTSGNAAAWVGAGEKVTYTVDNADELLTTSAFYFCTNSTAAPDYTGYYRNSDLLLIPQNLDGVKLTIDYTIKSTGGEEIAQQHVVTYDSSSKWDIGYRYIYNIQISFDPINLNPIVEVFVDANGDIAI